MSGAGGAEFVPDEETAASIERAKLMVRTYGFAFRQRYRLPPTDPLFLAATPEQMMDDYWAHRLVEDPSIGQVPVDALRARLPDLLAKDAVRGEPQA